jgi:hypothetical protein
VDSLKSLAALRQTPIGDTTDGVVGWGQSMGCFSVDDDDVVQMGIAHRLENRELDLTVGYPSLVEESQNEIFLTRCTFKEKQKIISQRVFSQFVHYHVIAKCKSSTHRNFL